MRPEDIINASKHALKPGQTSRFHCTQCGDCCRHREDILLTPFDLFRIAGHLGITPGEVVKTYCEVYIGSSSHFPVVRLLPVGEDKACPFLKENRCAIHASKPTVCALFPLGRAMQYGALNGEQERKLFYIIQDVNCGLRDQTHTVEEWLGEFRLESSEAWFLEWTDDFACGCLIQGFDNITSVIRSRGIYVSVIIQSIAQLESLYGNKAATICENCDTTLYLGGNDPATARWIGERANRASYAILSMPVEDALLIQRGKPAKKVRRYMLEDHQDYVAQDGQPDIDEMGNEGICV